MRIKPVRGSDSENHCVPLGYFQAIYISYIFLFENIITIIKCILYTLQFDAIDKN
jgi:hypothetical protein